MKARDLMHRRVITVRRDTTLKEASILMSKNRVNGLPVVEEEGKLVGIITDSDILQYRQKINLPEYMRLIEYFLGEVDPEGIEDSIREIMHKKVEEVMTTHLITLREDSQLGEIISKFAEHHIGRLPVVKENKLVGLVSREDVIRAFAEKY
ncbi:MAG: CBS domain-containing protein [Candidatus Syntrophonatronum acetioxidans]|uniref:CBS domain-containing protein n=1 Tax=Candidatus Syntrophonatronum acetioxidans TaxID=1795816 RepID=A0A424YGY2_9FIRM|nr:MAG: CBS domain-containing protein [Candidatus Syntrophonatronum acetioxidans]